MRMGGHRSILIGGDPVTVNVAQGGELVVEAEENPTTGYVWQLAAEPPEGLEVLEDSSVPSGPAPGSGGLRRWRVRVGKGPRVLLRATLQRPWESASSAQRTATATVIVNP